MSIHRAYSTFLSPLVLIFILAIGCASLPQKISKEEALRNRVNALMQAKIDGKWDIVYDLYDSSYRKTLSREQFASRSRAMLFKNFSIETIEILPSGTEAKVKVRTDISMKGFDFKGAPENQNWIEENGKWFMKVKPQINPFAPRKK
jgi:hypothetical protein